jgi:hypothetical protein
MFKTIVFCCSADVGINIMDKSSNFGTTGQGTDLEQLAGQSYKWDIQDIFNLVEALIIKTNK